MKYGNLMLVVCMFLLRTLLKIKSYRNGYLCFGPFSLFVDYFRNVVMSFGTPECP